MGSSASFAALTTFFEKPVCAEAASPLRDGIEIGIQVGSTEIFTLKKSGGRLELLPSPPKAPDITFFLGNKTSEVLSGIESKDIGEIGILIIELMIQSDVEKRISARVHADSFTLLRNGYFGVLTLGGAPVMAHLAKKGFGNISKIKNALSRMRG